ncbi:MAG: thiamine-phosphate kinase [Thermoproteota archaeon]|nr:MAG: thiamine-phosphate kinase [Candidatus Korarchaeota archaeon]
MSSLGTGFFRNLLMLLLPLTASSKSMRAPKTSSLFPLRAASTAASQYIQEASLLAMLASEAGERKLIEAAVEAIGRISAPLQIGDDVAVVDAGGIGLVLKTDMLVASTDVPPQMAPWQVGWKAVVMNVSDMAAKGVKPAAGVLAIGVPGDYRLEDFKLLIKGASDAAREYGFEIVGGDTNACRELVVAVALAGVAKRIVPRSGAKPGDILATTGYFGLASAGLKHLLEGLPARPGDREALVKPVLEPKARLREGLALAPYASASIDSSDGLAWSVHELAKASGVGFRIEHIPIAPEAASFAEDNSLSPLDLALYGGEEYELVVTIPPESWSAAAKAVEEAGGRLIRVGVATREKHVVAVVDGREVEVEPRGYEHFLT